MSTRRIVPQVVSLMLAVLMLAACGATPTKPVTVPTPVPPTATAAPAPTTVAQAATKVQDITALTDTPAPPTPSRTPIISPTDTPAPPTATPTPILPPPTAMPSDTPVPPTPTPSPISPTSIPATMTVPDIDLVVDNQDRAFSTTGSWFIGDGGQSYNGDCHWAPRGIQNIAYVRPDLPEAGAYEVFAWWCGDPNHDQSQRARIQVYPYQGVLVPYQVDVNLQENAGQWNSLGTYNLGPGSFLSIDGNLHGNVVADAFRFVYQSPESAVIIPTPIPTQIPWTNQPPSPLEQLTSGDLSQRLGLVQRFYPHTPITSMEQATFDDCQAFPRDGCGGTRDGWRVQVEYQDMLVPYRVSQDYHFVAIEPPDSLTGRQVLYLSGTKNDRFFRVDRYPDGTWHLAGADLQATHASHLALEGEMVSRLSSLVQAYGSVTFETAEGIALRLYGLGERVQLSEGDRGRLAELGAELVATLGW